jgi:hypothetical protein
MENVLGDMAHVSMDKILVSLYIILITELSKHDTRGSQYMAKFPICTWCLHGYGVRIYVHLNVS